MPRISSHTLCLRRLIQEVWRQTVRLQTAVSYDINDFSTDIKRCIVSNSPPIVHTHETESLCCIQLALFVRESLPVRIDSWEAELPRGKTILCVAVIDSGIPHLALMSVGTGVGSSCPGRHNGCSILDGL